MNFKNETIDMYSETTWWTRRSKLEKLLLLSSLVALLVILSLIIALNSGKSHVCTSKECIKLSNNLLNSMDFTTDPCDDFYQFVCGNLMKNINANKVDVISVYKTNAFKVREQIRRIVEEPIELGDPKHLIAVKNFYRACMNETAIEAEGLKRLKGILRDLGGWPLLDGNKWSEGNFDWKLSIHKLRKIGYDFNLLLPISVDLDVRSGGKFIVYIDFPRILDHQDKLKREYFNYMLDMTVMMGMHTYAEKKELRELYDFEMKLFQIYPEAKYVSQDYTKYTVNELQLKYPSVPWYEFINGILYPRAHVNFAEEIIVKNSNFLRRLLNFIQNTPKRTLANFISWNVLHHFAPFLTKKTQMIMLRYGMGSFSQTENHSTFVWEHCINSAISKLQIPILYEYTKRHSPEKSFKFTKNLAEIIRIQFQNTITPTKWIDDETRKFSLEKLLQMKIHIGVPNKLYDDNLLNDIYEPVEIHEDKYLASVLNIDFLNTNFVYEKLHHQVEEYLWMEQLLPFNLYVKYVPEKNSLHINPLYLEDGLLFMNKDNYVNFAIFGTLIAKEMAKLLTDGQFFTNDGIFQGWNSRHYHELYAVKDQCLKNLYTNSSKKVDIEIKVPEYPVLEDVFGLATAYDAYSTWIHLHGNEKSIPGLDYTDHQLFWLTYALQTCSSAQSDNIVIPNIVNKNTVNVPLQHMIEFSELFMCNNKTNMNSHICQL